MCNGYQARENVQRLPSAEKLSTGVKDEKCTTDFIAENAQRLALSFLDLLKIRTQLKVNKRKTKAKT